MLTYVFPDHFRTTSAATVSTSGQSRCSASANISIVEINTAVRNLLLVPRCFREPWFSDPFRESLGGASALLVFTSGRLSYFKPKIKLMHGGFGRCSHVVTLSTPCPLNIMIFHLPWLVMGPHDSTAQKKHGSWSKNESSGRSRFQKTQANSGSTSLKPLQSRMPVDI